MDGATPTAASPGYNGPINVSGTVTIKAIAIAPAHLQSAATTAAYTITSLPTEAITTIAGDGAYGFSGVGGPATSASLGAIYSMALDAAGNLYTTDGANNVVWMVSANTGLITTVAGTVARGTAATEAWRSTLNSTHPGGRTG